MAPLPSLHTTACFLVVCVASSTLAEYCRKAKLPLITGYILAGIVCGPCVLSLLSQPASAQLSELINDDAMGFIGFSAGSKFLLSELRGQLRLVMSVLLGLVGVTYALVLGGLASDPLTQNSCPVGWGNVTDSGVTVNCAGIVGGGVSEGGTVSGTGRWSYDKTVKNDDGSIEEVHFTVNEDHWDAPSGNHPTRMVVVSYPSHDAVKAALIDGSLDAVMGAGVLTETDVAELKRDHADKLDQLGRRRSSHVQHVHSLARRPRSISYV